MIDLLAYEYGWTDEYILYHKTPQQIEAISNALTRRYERMKEAMKDANK